MRSLPVDKRGYPVPWFVEWVGGEPEFRASSRRKILTAIREERCWVCGGKLWPERVFTIGPMCAVNRISSEPPSHRQCAQFSAIACPFLSRPHMTRREDDVMNEENFQDHTSGLAISRNPGATLLWFTRRFEVIKVPAIPSAGANEGILFKLGRPFKVEWYAKGRPATRSEVLESIESGLPLLYETNRRQAETIGGDVEELDAAVRAGVAEAMKLLPR